MLESFETTGYWWLPDQPDRKLPGRLKYSPEDGGTLELDDVFQTGPVMFDAPESQEIILGNDNNVTPITLHKCVPSQYNVGLIGIGSKCEYRVRTIFKGTHFAYEQQIKFANLAASYTDLHEWVGLNYFDLDKDGDVFHIRYKRPDGIEFRLNDNTSAGIEFSFQINPVHFGKEISGKTGTFFKVECRDGERDFFPLFQGLTHLSRLLMLAVSRLVYPIQLVGHLERDQVVEKGRLVYGRGVAIYYRLIEPPVDRKPLMDNEMLFTFRDVESRFENLLERWFSSANDLKSVYDLYFATLFTQRSFIDHRFLNIVQALETYHRIRISRQVLPTEEHEARVQEVLSTVPGKHKIWVEGLLHPANQPSFKMRLWDLLTKYDPVMASLVEDKPMFIRKVVATRNRLTHHSENKDAITDRAELFATIQNLTILLEAAFLDELGFSLDQIVEMQQRRRKWYLKS